jgi:CRP-like cAMP-binding protein
MLKRLTKQSSQFLDRKPPLLNRFLLLIISIMSFNVIGETISTTLLLSKAGPKHLLLCHLIIGVLSIPAYTVFSQLVQRFSHLKLLKYLLLGTILFILILRFLLKLNTLPVYYFVFISFNFQWILLVDIMFPSLVFDYFTVLEWKRYTHFLAIAQAAGGLLGGALVSWLANYLITENMLLVIPLLSGVSLVQIISLQNFQKNTIISSQEQELGKRKSEEWKKFFTIIKAYPIALFLAIDIVLLVIILTFAEFLYLSVYSHYFPNEQELTGFLGLMNISNYTLQFFIPYFFTQPLIQRLGIRTMNLVYPITTLVGFLGLAVNFHLPTGMFLHFNSDSFNGGINSPVQILNYNAVPHRLMVQIRSLNQGIFSSLARAFAGGGLWLCQSVLTPLQITQIGITLSFMFLLVRHLIGKNYLASQLKMLYSISINLDELNKGSIVRNSAAIMSADYVKMNLPVTQNHLKLSAKNKLVKAALSVAGQVRTKKADDILFNYLVADYQELTCSLRWQQEISQNEPSCRFLVIAIADYHQRLINQALYLLSYLGYSDLVNTVKVLLLTKDNRDRANAVEALICLPEQRIVQPLLPLLQQWASDSLENYTPPASRRRETNGYRSLLAALQSKERWLQIGALLALAALPKASIKFLEPEALIKSSDPLVQEVAKSVFEKQPHWLHIDWLNSLLLLNNVPLFRHFSLDELLSIEATFESTKFARGEIIFTEGSLVHHFYLIASGTVTIVKHINNQQQELTQLGVSQHFGEMALFDNSPYSTGALATSDCIVLKLEKNCFLRLLIEYPHLGVEICKFLSQCLRARNNPFQEKIGNYQERTQPDKLFSYEKYYWKKKDLLTKRLKSLKDVSLFKNLNPDELLHLEILLQQEELLAGETIFLEGSLGQYLYIITSGRVRIVKHINNQPQELAQLGIGQYFGEMELFDTFPRSTGAFADTDCTLLLLDSKRLLSLVIQRSQIMVELCKSLSQRLRETENYLEL